MESRFKELRERLAEIQDLAAAGAVLGWDQQVNMPPGGAGARASQMATIGKLVHEKFIDPGIGRLLEELAGYEQAMPYESDEASIIRVTRRDYERASRVPPEFTSRMERAFSEAFQVWAAARPKDDYGTVMPYLQANFDICQEYADFFPGYEHPLDPLIDNHDHGMKASEIREVFARLRKELVPLVDTITSQEPADDSCLRQTFDREKQLAFGEEVIRAFGYDFDRGRQDLAPHPFTTGFSVGDVRITTRVLDDYLVPALFGTMHEAGHAMYEQGVDPALEGTPLASGSSIGVHESQSRLWENIVGRSRQFWEHNYPRLREFFPGQLASVSLDAFYRAINRVERSLIRVEADEVTYNLHVMMRFDFECDIMTGRMSMAELPEAWKERMESDVGIRPQDDRDGVLQDIHWYNGIIGYFQGYTLGNIMSAQFYEAALRAHPGIPEEIAAGNYGTLHDWLRENIYRHGRKFTTAELLERVTGQELNTGPYIRYLKAKYSELYDL